MIYTTSKILHLAKLNVEEYLPSRCNTIYTGYINRHSPLWRYSNHNATLHIIEDMLTASNLIPLHDEAATLTLYQRSTDEQTRPKPRIRIHCEQNTMHCARRDRKRLLTNTLHHVQNNAASTYTDMEMELRGVINVGSYSFAAKNRHCATGALIDNMNETSHAATITCHSQAHILAHVVGIAVMGNKREFVVVNYFTLLEFTLL